MARGKENQEGASNPSNADEKIIDGMLIIIPPKIMITRELLWYQCA